MSAASRIRILGRHEGGITDVLALTDDSVLTSGTDGTVRQWTGDGDAQQVPGSAAVKTLVQFGKAAKRGEPTPHALSLDLAGDTLACGMKHGVVELRDLASGKLIRALDNPPAGTKYAADFCRVCFNPADARQLLGTNRGYVNIWGTATGAILHADHQFDTANTVGFLRGGSLILVQEWEPRLHLFKWPGGKRVRWQYDLMDGSFNFVTTRIAPPGAPFDFLLSAVDADGGHVVAMNIDREESLWQIELRDRQHDIDIAPDGRRIFVGGDEGTLRVLNPAGKELLAVDVDEHPVPAAEAKADEASPKAGVILTTNDLEDGFSYATAIHRLKRSPDGRSVLLGLVGGLLLRVDVS